MKESYLHPAGESSRKYGGAINNARRHRLKHGNVSIEAKLAKKRHAAWLHQPLAASEMAIGG